MNNDDHAYWYRRAEAELEMAQRTDCTAAVMAHADLAERYLALCYLAPASVEEPGEPI